MRLDHFLAKRLGISERSAREQIALGFVRVDDEVLRDHKFSVDKFSGIQVRDELVQQAIQRIRIMLNKPVGILSATSDPVHSTVIDLIDHPEAKTLHLAGRLDRSSSGLILLSNDGQWTESLTDPEQKVEKEYLVQTDRDIPKQAVSLFAEGFDFEPEGITTLPADLEILGRCEARVILREGRYHQIKRMFHRIDGIRLRGLHRVRIGEYRLPGDWEPGHWKEI